MLLLLRHKQKMRKEIFVTDNVYHLYNRGVDKRLIFPDDSHFSRFISILRHYLNYDYGYSLLLQRGRVYNDVRSLAPKLEQYRWEKPLLEILSLCLMPNHFHLQVKQLVDDGVTTFMHRLGTSYTNYFNILHERTGSLFQGPFKAVRVESEGQFLCLNRYIHVNPIPAGLVGHKNLLSWRWSSLPEYLGRKEDKICNVKEILHYFRDTDDYLDFVLAAFKEGDRENLEKLAIDDDFGWFEEMEEQKKKLRGKLMERLRRG